MRMIDVLTSPWAIQPAKLAEITDVYSRHLKGEKIDIKALEAKMGQPLENEHRSYDVVDGVAILDVTGVIARRANMFTKISGGLSTEILAAELQQALNDSDVESIILDIDSPGGTVDGTADIARTIYQARGSKPIVALANGLMASAAYWIGSAADAIYVANETTTVGSIGVVTTHTDYSGQLKQNGITVTEIYAGKYKRLSSEYKPLSKEGKAEIQSHVDYLYSIFVETVAKHRGVDVDTVLNEMADGKTFVGQQAIDAGLADGMITMGQLISDLSSGVVPAQAGASVVADNVLKHEEENSMDITKEYLLENHADLVEEFRAEGAASVEAVDTDTIAAEAAEKERNRIQSVMDQSLPGYEAEIKEMAFDGHTTAEVAAVKILQKEKAARGNALADLEAEASEVVVPAAIDAVSTPAARADEDVDARCERVWKDDATVRAEFNNDYDAFVAFERAVDSGQVKVLGGKK